MRRSFVRALTEIVRANNRVFLLTGDLGFSVLENFKELYPNNFLNAGVAEQNMVGMASGMASEGRLVFVYSIATFLVYRALEQIRYDICYHNLPVKIIGVGGGLAYGNAGPSHHSTEDLAIMTSLPNMTVIAPGDPIEAERATKQSIELDGPCYIRLNRSGETNILPDSTEFTIGKGIELSKGQDMTILSSGGMLETGYQVRSKLFEKGISCGLVSMHTLKPFDSALLEKVATHTSLIVTLEEHSPYGGLSSIVSKHMKELALETPLLTFTLPDSYADSSGSQNYLRKYYQLDAESLFAKIYRYFISNEGHLRGGK